MPESSIAVRFFDDPVNAWLHSTCNRMITRFWAFAHHFDFDFRSSTKGMTIGFVSNALLHLHVGRNMVSIVHSHSTILAPLKSRWQQRPWAVNQASPSYTLDCKSCVNEMADDSSHLRLRLPMRRIRA